jgi:hypothetical protein
MLKVTLPRTLVTEVSFWIVKWISRMFASLLLQCVCPVTVSCKNACCHE